MNWKYIKPLNSEKLIDDFEQLVCYFFPNEFKSCVRLNNGGRPAYKRFDTDKNIGREIKSFLSFNFNDKETVWKIYEWNEEELSNKYIAFAIDNFGNLICFDSKNDGVVFFNHENSTIELIASSFVEFMNLLYK